MKRINGHDVGRAIHACRKAGHWLGSVPAMGLMRCGAMARLAIVDRGSRVIGVLGRDSENDALHRLVPAFYDAY